MAKRITQNQSGFTLVEILIALTVFAFFAGAMVFRLTNNVSGSMQMATDLTMHNLAELKMNETLIGKKEFTNATENDPDTGSFEIEGYEKYKFKVQISKLELPDFSQLIGQGEDEENSDTDNAQTNKVQKLIFEKLKSNIEEMIWQVTVTITGPEGDEYSLNSWINKSNAKIDTNFSF